MKTRRELRLLTATIIVSALMASPSTTVAQGQADNYSIYKEADVHAACNSKDLPGRGYTILQVVPNTKGKDCYWKRGSLLHSRQSETRPAIEAARARRDAAIRELDAMRKNGWSAFWRHFEGCAGDKTCQSEVVRARMTIEQDLDAKVARANQRFQDEMRSLLHSQIRQETPVGTNTSKN